MITEQEIALIKSNLTQCPKCFANINYFITEWKDQAGIITASIHRFECSKYFKRDNVHISHFDIAIHFPQVNNTNISFMTNLDDWLSFDYDYDYDAVLIDNILDLCLIKNDKELASIIIEKINIALVFN